MKSTDRNDSLSLAETRNGGQVIEPVLICCKDEPKVEYFEVEYVPVYDGPGHIAYYAPVYGKCVSNEKEDKRNENIHNGVEYIDLGLSVLWATHNIGAEYAEDNRCYFAWGETDDKFSYREINSKTWGEKFSEIGGNAEYDAASAIYGGGWRLPTIAEFEELAIECELNFLSVKDKYGYERKGCELKRNGKSIFLPACGAKMGLSTFGDQETCIYWSSSPLDAEECEEAGAFIYSEKGFCPAFWQRFSGLPVRPVLDRENINIQ